MSAARTLDVITIGRASVDLYGQQIGSRLEDIGSFAKSVGGCPANIAIGTARLGLQIRRCITRVGDEQMGRFIRSRCSARACRPRGIVTDPERLTALVLLAVEDEGVSPMIFYRTDCADMALAPTMSTRTSSPRRARSSSPARISRAPTPKPRSARRSSIAKANGGKVVFDIDYRPNLWGLAGHAEGFERYVKSDRVSAKLQDGAARSAT